MARVKVKETRLGFDGPLVKRLQTNFIVVHHVGPLGMMMPQDVDAAVIHEWHQHKGWSGVGYHYVILADGIIQRGRPRDMIGSHCKGYNSESLGICVVGNFQKSQPTEAQTESLCNLLADLHDIYKLDASREETVLGHRDLNPATECPGDNLYRQLPDIRKKVVALCK